LIFPGIIFAIAAIIYYYNMIPENNKICREYII
jgi:hypothetical protein